MNDFDFSEHKTGNLLVAVRLPLDAVTPELLRSLLPEFIPVPFALRKTGLGFASGPTIVQLPMSPFVEVEFETEMVIVEPERFVYLPPRRHSIVAPSESATWGIVETGVDRSSYRGGGISVAVLDSGLDLGHPDFIGRVALNDQIDLTGTGIDDVLGHGTYCAGIACGPVKPKGTGRYGVAAESRLLIGKVFDATETRSPDFQVMSGILWAALRGADVISLSWGLPIAPGKRHSKIYEFVTDVLLTATQTIVIAATGNGSQRPLDLSPIYHPANCPSIIAVAGLNPDLTVARFSCGAIGHQREPSLSAPGVDVISSVPRRFNPSDPYAKSDGTSASAAFVAGIAALWAQQSTYRGAALQKLVISKYKALTEPAKDVGSGLSIAP